MANLSDIAPHMEVLGVDGVHIGTVDHLDGDRIKLARNDSADNRHHYVPLSAVARVDTHVHLAITAAAALAGEGAWAAAPAPYAAGETASRNWVPWLVGLAVLLVLLLLGLRTCAHRDQVATAPEAAPVTAPLPVEAVALPNGTSVNLEPRTLNYELQRYLASNEATPKTFQFDKLNFDTGSAAIRAEDRANVDALAQILAAYPNARAKVAGYTDARGTAPANAQLGQQRADAVVAALVAKGIANDRIEAVSGGESTPTDTNATAQGQFENRRTELIVTAK